MQGLNLLISLIMRLYFQILIKDGMKINYNILVNIVRKYSETKDLIIIMLTNIRAKLIVTCAVKHCQQFQI